MRTTVIKAQNLIVYYLLLLLCVLFPAAAIYSIRISDKTEPWYVEAFFWSFLVFSIGLIIWDVFRGMASERFVINDRGVTYKKAGREAFIPWQKVERIALSPDAYMRISKNSFIMFMTESGAKQFPIILRKDFNKEIFGVQYRRSIVEAIRRYTDIPIAFIDEVQGSSL